MNRSEPEPEAPEAPEAGKWIEANQSYLAAALAVVRTHLERHAARDGAPSMELPGLPEWPGYPPPAIEHLCATFGLSPFERDVLLLCAGMELDGRFAALCADAQSDPQRAYPTFGLALAALPDAHWSALSPAAPLRYWKLVEVGGGHALTRNPLRIDERVLHYLTGVSYTDERLTDLLDAAPATQDLVPSHRALATQIAALWSEAAGREGLPVIQLCGPEAAGRRAVAAAACEALGLGLAALRADVLPVHPADLGPIIRLWEREAVLSTSALLVECDDLGLDDAVRVAAVTRLVERARGALLLSARERWRVLERPTVTFDAGRPDAGEQAALWHEALGESAPGANGQVDVLVSQFDLGAGAIRTAAAEARGRLAQEGAPHPGALWDACRRQARPRLDDLAQRIEPAATWDDLVLPEAQRQLLREAAAHVRQRRKVYHTWGFATKGKRGLGISALFTGPSGTGKTMAAEVLANELRLDLYRIDLASVVSKYVGETEKNLRRIFDAAEEGGVILLFDEADALFGKRSEVKDSHDRYANIEIGYLLQRMECYRGLAILTTNFRSALDPAFLRRLRFIVQFPFPDAVQRAEIWSRIFPAATPAEGLDPAKLARLNVAGGNIRNIALNAAFLAADAGEPVRMAHLLQAARSEYLKLERTLTEAEVEGWVRGTGPATDLAVRGVTITQ